MGRVQADRCVREFLEALRRGDLEAAERSCKSGASLSGEVVFPGRVAGYRVGDPRPEPDGDGLVYAVRIDFGDGAGETWQALVTPRIVVSAACYVARFNAVPAG